jgi:peptidoglycan/LPS O-acetylase OafA/YrhL
VVQAVQAAGILLAAILAGVAALSGKSYQTASGIAITAIGIGTAIALGYVAYGLARSRRWSRTPALLTQLFTGIVGIYLVQGHRWSWGVPALVLCLAGFVLILVPPSIRALTEIQQKGS